MFGDCHPLKSYGYNQKPFAVTISYRYVPPPSLLFHIGGANIKSDYHVPRPKEDSNKRFINYYYFIFLTN